MMTVYQRSAMTQPSCYCVSSILIPSPINLLQPVCAIHGFMRVLSCAYTGSSHSISSADTTLCSGGAFPVVRALVKTLSGRTVTLVLLFSLVS